jgi:hypothetical protein
MSKIDKIARLAFDPSAQEGEAIAAFLKLRAMKAGANVAHDHVQEPRETRQESTSRGSSQTVKYRIPHQVLSDYLETCRKHMNVSFGTSVKIRVTPDGDGKWEVCFICSPNSYNEVKNTCQAIFNVWTQRDGAAAERRRREEQEMRERWKKYEDDYNEKYDNYFNNSNYFKKESKKYSNHTDTKKKSFWEKIWS